MTDEKLFKLAGEHKLSDTKLVKTFRNVMQCGVDSKTVIELGAFAKATPDHLKNAVAEDMLNTTE